MERSCLIRFLYPGAWQVNYTYQVNPRQKNYDNKQTKKQILLVVILEKLVIAHCFKFPLFNKT